MNKIFLDHNNFSHHLESAVHLFKNHWADWTNLGCDTSLTILFQIESIVTLPYIQVGSCHGFWMVEKFEIFENLQNYWMEWNKFGPNAPYKM